MHLLDAFMYSKQLFLSLLCSDRFFCEPGAEVQEQQRENDDDHVMMDEEGLLVL